jgi:anti-sigma factor RsiW
VNTLASERYLLGEMSEDERQDFEEHYFSCTDCAEDVRAGGVMEDGARAGFVGLRSARPSSNVVRMPPAKARPLPVVLPWAVAATLAVVAGYQALAVRQPGTDAAPLALTPITLRPAARGAEAIVPLGAGSVVTLAIDLATAPAGREIDYELRSGERVHVAAGRVAAPQPGVPLLLMVPSRLLKRSEHYVLSAKDPGNAGLTLGEYRFTVDAR